MKKMSVSHILRHEREFCNYGKGWCRCRSGSQSVLWTRCNPTFRFMHQSPYIREMNNETRGNGRKRGSVMKRGDFKKSKVISSLDGIFQRRALASVRLVRCTPMPWLVRNFWPMQFWLNWDGTILFRTFRPHVNLTNEASQTVKIIYFSFSVCWIWKLSIRHE